jgi:hypothetical protein
MSGGRRGPFVERCAVLRRERVLPIAGEVLLDVGDRVEADTVVARAAGQGRLRPVHVARQLDILPAEVTGAMVVTEGARVVAGEVIARTRGLFGLFAASCRAPAAGTVVAISDHTGQVLLEEPADPLAVAAFLPGIVADVHPRRGVTVTGWAARVAGVFGVGGERSGELQMAVGRPEADLDGAALAGDLDGKVLVGGASVTADALARAADRGAAGVITGGIADHELAAWLSTPLVLADTTALSAPLTLVVVGGFGRVPLDPEAFALLREHAGDRVGLCGWTRVRAGALRPEVIVPLAGGQAAERYVPSQPLRLQPGVHVQIVRAPWFGRRGRVARLPEGEAVVESGIRTPVAEVDLDGGQTVLVPRANLEILGAPRPEEQE